MKFRLHHLLKVLRYFASVDFTATIFVVYYPDFFDFSEHPYLFRQLALTLLSRLLLFPATPLALVQDVLEALHDVRQLLFPGALPAGSSIILLEGGLAILLQLLQRLQIATERIASLFLDGPHCRLLVQMLSEDVEDSIA